MLHLVDQMPTYVVNQLTSLTVVHTQPPEVDLFRYLPD